MKGWNNAIAAIPGAHAHLFQTTTWAENKHQTGWEPIYWAWYENESGFSSTPFDPRRPQPVAAAVILKRRLRMAGFAARMSVMYAPKGPLLDWNNPKLRQQVLEDLSKLARRNGAIFVKIDPDIKVSDGYPHTADYQPALRWKDIESDLLSGGWRASSEQIQFRNTVVIDLTTSEAELLAKMKQKTRYNIRLAERKGVVIRVGNQHDLPLLYRMYAETSIRDGFVIRDSIYYLNTWQAFLSAGWAEILIADVAGEAVAAVIIFRFANQAWYLYGMSRDIHREKMPNYLLQWEAIRRAKAAGCLIYDLWGAPDEPENSDPMWGVYRFKEGLGGQVVCTMGAWDLPTRPFLYQFYTTTLPRILTGMRKAGRQKTLREVET